jgi:hypothetical protein
MKRCYSTIPACDIYSVESRLMLHGFFGESLNASSLAAGAILLSVHKVLFCTCKIVGSVSLGYLHNEFTADGVTNENNPETENNKFY